MASIKVARTQLHNAGMPANLAQEFMNKLNAVFGSNWCSHGNSGIGNGGTLLLAKENFRAFLAERPNAPDVVINITVPDAVPVVPSAIVADYYENDDGTYQCNYCNHKAYKRERDCIKHLQTKHVEKLED